MIVTEDQFELFAILYAAPLQAVKWQSFFARACVLNTVSGGILTQSPTAYEARP